MRTRSRAKREYWRSSWMSTVGLSVLCLTVFTGLALAKEQPPDQESKGEAQAEPPDGAEEKPDATPADEASKQSQDPPEPEPLVAGETAPGVGTTSRQSSTPSTAKRLTVTNKAKDGKSRKFEPKSRKPSRSTRKPAFKTDPNAKWVCDQTVSNVDPVWRGDKKLTFDFHIRNEGTADLEMKAKGG